MVFNRFFFKILFRVLIITAVLFTIVYIFPRTDLLFSQLILIAIALFQIGELTYFLNRTNHDLARFLDSLKDGDFTIGFNRSENTKSFDKLQASFNELAEVYKRLETANATQSHFLTQVVNQIDFGIVAFDEKDQIILINEQAQVLLELPAVSNWQKIRNPNTQFLQNILEFADIRNELIETRIAGHIRFFSTSVITVVILNQKYRIASFQDIKSELQVKEIEAFHKLIRILNHEILNSVTPLISLSETIQLILQKDDKERKSAKDLDQQNLDDIYEAVDTIKQRSVGILKFANDYRKLTRIPNPDFKEINLNELINGVIKLHQKSITDLSIKIEYDSAPFELKLDRFLIEQVLINIIKNAIESFAETQIPKIKIYCETDSKYFFIRISDNGQGISSEKMAKIFIPFYTTKKGGSGVGLSISRQIMNLHGGYLEINSNLGGPTICSLIFPLHLLKSVH